MSPYGRCTGCGSYGRWGHPCCCNTPEADWDNAMRVAHARKPVALPQPLTPPCVHCGWETPHTPAPSVHAYLEATCTVFVDPRDVQKFWAGQLFLPVTHCELCGQPVKARA